MIFKSYQNLFHDVMARREHIPPNVSEVVGIPRSGIIPSLIISHILNVPFRTLPEYLSKVDSEQGSTRDVKTGEGKAADSILLIDDSVHSGRSMQTAFERLSGATDKHIIRLCVYGITVDAPNCDIVLNTTDANRVFEWNMFHRKDTTRFGFDLDGVFCPDPCMRDNDDGPRYREFINNAPCILAPSYTLGSVITSRLEKYRHETETWLSRHNIKYLDLFMLGGVTADQRRQQSLHHKHKIKCLKKNPQIELFVESDARQAEKIAHDVGIPVYCTDTTELMAFKTFRNEVQLNVRKAWWKLVR